MFVDGDDFIHSCACEILLRNLINTQADICLLYTSEYDGCVIYPSEYFSPINYNTMRCNITDNTYAIHYYNGTCLLYTSRCV